MEWYLKIKPVVIKENKPWEQNNLVHADITVVIVWWHWEIDCFSVPFVFHLQTENNWMFLHFT